MPDAIAHPMLNTPEVQASIVVKTLNEMANRVPWIPIGEMEAFWIRYPEMEVNLKSFEYDLSPSEDFLHAFGPRLLLRYRYYHNEKRVFRHGLHGNVALIKPETYEKLSDTDKIQFQPFTEDYFVNLHITLEVTHFTYLLVA